LLFTDRRSLLFMRSFATFLSLIPSAAGSHPDDVLMASPVFLFFVPPGCWLDRLYGRFTHIHFFRLIFRLSISARRRIYCHKWRPPSVRCYCPLDGDSLGRGVNKSGVLKFKPSATTLLFLFHGRISLIFTSTTTPPHFTLFKTSFCTINIVNVKCCLIFMYLSFSSFEFFFFVLQNSDFVIISNLSL